MLPTPLPSMPFEQPHPSRPAPLLRALQTRGPVHRVRTRAGDEAWLVTGYEQVRQLLGDDRLGRAHPEPDRAARANDSAVYGGRPLDNHDTEQADRAWFRDLLRPFFTAPRMRALRPRVRKLVDELLDGLAAAPRPADLNRHLSEPLPVRVICELLGVPAGDPVRLRAFSEAVAAADDRRRSETGLAELSAHLRPLATRAHPEGIVAELRRAHGGALGDDVIASVAAMILFAGTETTVTQLGYGALLLLTNPDQRQAIVAAPQRLTAAVEECLRAGNAGVNAGGNGIPYYARTDLDVGGVRIRAWDLVLLDTGAANHDERVFGEPDRFDIGRPPNGHLSFGHGVHYCIGAPLARLELHAALSGLIRRFPTMRLAVPLASLRSRDDLVTGGLAELPVTW